jgi:hypothetical protein
LGDGGFGFAISRTAAAARLVILLPANFAAEDDANSTRPQQLAIERNKTSLNLRVRSFDSGE